MVFKLLIFIGFFLVNPSVYSKGFTGICGQKLKDKKFLKVQNKYAKGFEIKKYKGFYLLTINQTWDKARKPQNIFLVENSLHFPSTCQKNQVINIPVKKVASFSTTHLPALEILDEIKSLKAFSNLKFAYNSDVQKSEKEGNIFELGSPPSGERLLALNPDAIFAYSTIDPKVEGISSLLKLKLPLIFISEFREKHPLARAEWVKVFGALYGKLDLAKTKFREIEKKYNEITEVALQARPKRKVLIGELMKGVWKAPGGKSDLATIVADAGGQYIWGKDEGEKTQSFNLEKVLVEGKDAEVWLPHNLSKDLKSLMKEEEYKKLGFIEDLNILNNTNRLTDSGGNDYWESALMRPDLLIQDLLRIFHPILLPNHELIWYKKLE